ncbi:MAG: HD-GYP domain-containing protein [Acidobacteria bacterium]|nr:HD-GYP domain-containing protein [Acidobacteriota bacterium]
MRPGLRGRCRAGTAIMRIEGLNAGFYEKLLTIWEKLNASLELDYILLNAMSYLEETLDAERSSIWELDEAGEELFFRVFSGGNSEIVEEIRLKIGEGVAGHTAKISAPVIIEDAEHSEFWSVKVDEKTHFQTKTILSVPLLFRDKVVGVVQLINKKNGGVFTGRDLRSVEMMCIPIATALVNAKLFKELEKTFMETALALADAIEKRDRYTAGHTRRVTRYSLWIADEMKLPSAEKKWLALSGILHDIGKIGIRDNILNKDGPLANDEFETMKQHTVFGAEIVQKIHSLKNVVDGILYHHEKMDGSGYPKGLKGEKIPLFARIIAVADTYDAMTTDRPYRKGLSHDAARDELQRMSGTQFDPEVVKAFLNRLEREVAVEN